MTKWGEVRTGKSHLRILKEDLYPHLQGRNLARWVIRTSHIAIEPDTRLPQSHVRCHVNAGRTTLELSDVSVLRPSMRISLVPGSAGTVRERDGTAYSRSVLYASCGQLYCAARRTSSVHGEAHPNGRHSYLSRFIGEES
jgi:hypothetical protein